jgi:hypothetical protein
MLNADTFDVFVFTRDIGGSFGMELFLMKNVPVNPNPSTAVQILSSPVHEDNPHIERLNDTTLLLFFDRERYIYYSLSYDNGTTWGSPILVTNVLNDQAPYDVQPHLWNDGYDWWVFFSANNNDGIRCIYKSKQMIPNNWSSWGSKQLVIEPNINISGGHGLIFSIGEPTLTQWGDLYFVVVYGDLNSTDTTDVFDCDPWILPRKQPVVTGLPNQTTSKKYPIIYPNPTSEMVYIVLPNYVDDIVDIVNSSGEVIYYKRINGQNIELDVSNLRSGIYLVKLRNNSLITTWEIIFSVNLGLFTNCWVIFRFDPTGQNCV